MNGSEKILYYSSYQKEIILHSLNICDLVKGSPDTLVWGSFTVFSHFSGSKQKKCYYVTSPRRSPGCGQ